MRVERATGRRMLDMTWVNVQDVLRHLDLFAALESGKGLTHEQIIELQKTNVTK